MRSCKTLMSLLIPNNIWSGCNQYKWTVENNSCAMKYLPHWEVAFSFTARSTMFLMKHAVADHLRRILQPFWQQIDGITCSQVFFVSNIFASLATLCCRRFVSSQCQLQTQLHVTEVCHLRCRGVILCFKMFVKFWDAWWHIRVREVKFSRQ